MKGKALACRWNSEQNLGGIRGEAAVSQSVMMSLEAWGTQETEHG